MLNIEKINLNGVTFKVTDSEKYKKPSSGIPESDLGNDVREKLNKKYQINGTMISPNADFAEVGEWYDGNVNNENRIGRFVTLKKEVEGFVIDKATSTSDVCGVVVEAPAFSGNAEEKYDSNDNLLRKYAYIALLGLVSVVDNGLCTVPGKCMPASDGTAIPSTNSMGFNVISRIDATHVEVFVRPGADMLKRIKDDIDTLNSSKQDALSFEGTYNATTNKVATKSYVDSAVSGLVDSAPETLDTLNELAAALGDDPNFATTISTQIGSKADAEDIPTKTSDLTNDSGFVTSSYHDSTKQDALPAITNDKYLHTNASTGALEWANADAVIEVESLPTSGIKTNVIYRLKKPSTESYLGTLINRYSPRTDIRHEGYTASIGIGSGGMSYFCKYKWLNLSYDRVVPAGVDALPIEQYWSTSTPRTYGESVSQMVTVNPNGDLVRYTDKNGLTQACHITTWSNSFYSYEYYSYNGHTWNRLLLDQDLESELQSYMPLIDLPTGRSKDFNYVLRLNSDATASYIWEEQTEIDVPTKTSDLTNDSNYVTDAPADSKRYVRKNNQWEELNIWEKQYKVVDGVLTSYYTKIQNQDNTSFIVDVGVVDNMITK